MVHKQVNLPLVVTGVRSEDDRHSSVLFARPPGFEYEAGDWIDLEAPQGMSGGRTYSLSSSPTEPDPMITFKHGLSALKQQLEAAQPGDQYRVSAYGNDYDFRLQQHRSSVLIAGGVGVAPFRSMLAQMADTGSREQTHLLYLNRGTGFLFETELRRWATTQAGVTVDLVDTSDMKRKQRVQLLAACVDPAVSYYYVAGPPAMVESTEEHLMAAGVSHDDIRVDIFGGY